MVQALDPGYNGNLDGFVFKLQASGAALSYSTYLGGNNNDLGAGIGIDRLGFAYVTGNTFSTDFPTKGAFDSTYSSGADAFVSCLYESGDSLVYSTYLGVGGFDFGYGIAVDTGQNAYVAGYTSSFYFPVAGAIQDSSNGAYDLFLTRMAIRPVRLC